MTPEEFNRIPAEEWVYITNVARYTHMTADGNVLVEHPNGAGVTYSDYENFRRVYTRIEPWRKKFDELKAVDDSWTLHEKGTECPCVGQDMDVLWSDGELWREAKQVVSSDLWTDTQGTLIVAYRIIKPALEPLTLDSTELIWWFRNGVSGPAYKVLAADTHGVWFLEIGFKNYRDLTDGWQMSSNRKTWYQAAQNGKDAEV